VLDIKLRATATALKSWSAKHVGNVRLQLAIAKEIVFRFDCAQENRMRWRSDTRRSSIA